MSFIANLTSFQIGVIVGIVAIVVVATVWVLVHRHIVRGAGFTIDIAPVTLEPVEESTAECDSGKVTNIVIDPSQLQTTETVSADIGISAEKKAVTGKKRGRKPGVKTTVPKIDKKKANPAKKPTDTKKASVAAVTTKRVKKGTKPATVKDLPRNSVTKPAVKPAKKTRKSK